VAEIAPDSTANDIAASKTPTVEPESAPATNPVFSHELGPGSEPTRDGAKPAMSDSFHFEATSEDTQHSRASADAGVRNRRIHHTVRSYGNEGRGHAARVGGLEECVVRNKENDNRFDRGPARSPTTTIKALLPGPPCRSEK
jgi:hypothetical protein